MMKLSNVYQNKDGTVYNEAVITFDIETTSMFRNPDGSVTNTPKDKDNRIPLGCMYHWQMYVDGEIILGRTWDELADTFEEIQKGLGKKIVWIHNLSFEFQWLINLFTSPRFARYKVDVFARESHKVIKCTWGSIEFRCTYFLTNMTLKKAGDEFKLKHRKASGDLDYRVLRGCTTPLSHKEKEYCRLDVLVLAELVKKFRDMYGTLDNIPLTSTGRLRRECQMVMKNDTENRATVKEAYPDEVLFPILRQAFAGGYTHANFYNAGYTVNDVDSYDIASSYPTVIVSEKFPTKFTPVKVDRIQEQSSTRAYLYHIKFFDIKPKCTMNYLSKSRSIACSGVVEDNGRILSCDWAEYWLTDVDVKIVMDNYHVGSYEIIECLRAHKQYLPKPLLEFVFKLYEDKTALKRVPGKEDAYAQSKCFINSMYGMTVTNDLRDEILFENGEFIKKEITLEDIKKELERKANSKKTFLLYQWGVWITAYARRNLWEAIHEIDDDVVYVDTDSTKILNGEDHRAWYEAYNDKIQWKIRKSIETNKLNVNYPPKDRDGIERPLGNFEHEDEYPVREFKTLGAKKYCYLGNDDKLHLTLSGVAKSASKYINGLDDFDEGKLFNEEQSGRSISWYINDQTPFTFVDCNGVTQECTERYSICIEPSTYVLGLSDDYRTLTRHSTHISVYGED